MQKERGEQNAQIKAESEGGESVRLINADALFAVVKGHHDLYNGATNPTDKARRDENLQVMCDITDALTIDAIPVEYLMKYAQLPTEFAIAAWRKQDKDAQKKRIKRLDKPMSFDDALNLVNDVFSLEQKKQEAR